VTSITVNGIQWVVGGMTQNTFAAVPFHVSSIVIAVVHNGTSFTVQRAGSAPVTGSISVNVALNVGVNTFTLFSTSGGGADGTTYTINITRQAAQEVFLLTLTAGEHTFVPALDLNNVFAYRIDVESDVNSITFNATVGLGFTVSGDGKRDLPNSGETPNQFFIRIFASGDTAHVLQEYEINVYRAVAPAPIVPPSGNDMLLYIIGGAAGGCLLLALVLLLILISVLKKNRNGAPIKKSERNMTPKQRAFNALRTAQDAVDKAKDEYKQYKDYR
jgi:hypothetical protein